MLNTATTIDSAKAIMDALSKATQDLVDAIQLHGVARQAWQAAREAHQDAEKESVAELIFADEGYAQCKNADARKMYLDNALVAARRDGRLSQTWLQLCAMKSSFDTAEIEFEKATARFRGCRAASELQSSMLRAMAA